MAKTKGYCTQNGGDCASCSLSSHGLDCMNVPLMKARAKAITVFKLTVHEERDGIAEIGDGAERFRVRAEGLEEMIEPVDCGSEEGAKAYDAWCMRWSVPLEAHGRMLSDVLHDIEAAEARGESYVPGEKVGTK